MIGKKNENVLVNEWMGALFACNAMIPMGLICRLDMDLLSSNIIMGTLEPQWTHSPTHICCYSCETKFEEMDMHIADNGEMFLNQSIRLLMKHEIYTVISTSNQTPRYGPCSPNLQMQQTSALTKTYGSVPAHILAYRHFFDKPARILFIILFFFSPPFSFLSVSLPLPLSGS